MALYRNIAGFGDGQQVGLTLVAPSGGGLVVAPIYPFDPARLQETQNLVWASKNTKYDWLMEHDVYTIFSAGYFVDTNGSVFQWTDESQGDAIAYLPIQDTQEIENGRGTAGALMMHLREPMIAQDTAGYAGGGSASSGSTDTYSEPIKEVKDLYVPPPDLPDGAVPFDPVIEVKNPDIPPPSTETGTLPVPVEETETTSQPTTEGVKEWLPMLALGAALIAVIKGDDLFKGKQKIVLLGGLGLYYYLTRKQTT